MHSCDPCVCSALRLSPGMFQVQKILIKKRKYKICSLFMTLLYFHLCMLNRSQNWKRNLNLLTLKHQHIVMDSLSPPPPIRAWEEKQKLWRCGKSVLDCSYLSTSLRLLSLSSWPTLSLPVVWFLKGNHFLTLLLLTLRNLQGYLPAYNRSAYAQIFYMSQDDGCGFDVAWV